MQTASDKSLDTMIIVQLAILPVLSGTYPLVVLPSSLDLITPSLPAIVCTTALLTHAQMGLILIFTLAQTAKDQTNRWRLLRLGPTTVTNSAIQNFKRLPMTLPGSCMTATVELLAGPLSQQHSLPHYSSVGTLLINMECTVVGAQTHRRDQLTSPLTIRVTLGLEWVVVPCSAYSHHLLGCLKMPLATGTFTSIISIIPEILAQVLLNSGFGRAWTGCVQMDIAQAVSTAVDTIKSASV